MGILRRGDRVAASAEAYVDAALPRLMAAAMSLTGNRHDAEDLVQDTVAKVLVHWGRVERADSADAYVRKVMVNTFVSGRRRRSSREVVSHELVTADRVAQRPGGTASPEDRDEMWTLLGTLTPRQRAVLVLRYYDDLPDAAIAEVLGCSAVSVRVTAHKALARLRERAPALGESPPCPEPTAVAATTSR